MSSKIQIAYFIVAGLGMTISIFFQWRKNSHDAALAKNSVYDRLDKVRTRVNGQILEAMYMGLIGIRQLYLHLDSDERLRRELEFVLNKPELVQALVAGFADLSRVESYLPRTVRARNIQMASSIVASTSLLGIMIPLVDWFVDKPIAFSSITWLVLTILLISLVLFLIASIVRMRLEHWMNSMLSIGGGSTVS
jgi:hypothetical protein